MHICRYKECFSTLEKIIIIKTAMHTTPKLPKTTSLSTCIHPLTRVRTQLKSVPHVRRDLSRYAEKSQALCTSIIHEKKQELFTKPFPSLAGERLKYSNLMKLILLRGVKFSILQHCVKHSPDIDPKLLRNSL